MNENVELNVDEILENVNIEVVLKSGKIVNLDELETGDVIGGIYDLWEYGGLADPVGQFSAIVSKIINAAIAPVRGTVDSIYSYVTGISGKVSNILSTLGGVASKVSTILSKVEGLPSAILSSISGALDSIKSFIESRLSSIADAVSNVRSAISSLFDYVQNILESLGEVYERLGGVLQSLQDVGSNIISFVGDTISSLQASVESFISSLRDYISGAISALQSAIGELGSRVESFSRSIIDTISNGLRNVSEFLGALSSRVQEMGKSLGEAIGNVASSIMETIRSISESISNALASFGETIREMYTGLSEVVRGLANAMSNAFTAFKETLANLGTTVLTQLESFGSTLSTFVTSLTKQIGEFIANIAGTIEDMFYKFRSIVTETIDDIMKKFGGWFAGITEGIRSIVSAFQGFINPLVEIKNWLATQLVNIGQWIWSGLTTAADTIKTVIVDPLVAGIESFLRDPLGTIAGALKPLADAVTDFYNKHIKPGIDWFNETVVQPTLQWIDDNIVKPILGFKDWIVEQITNAWEGLKKWFDDTFGWLTDIGKRIVDALKDPLKLVKDVVSWISSLLGTVVEPVTNAVKGVITALTNTVSGAVKSIVSGLTNTFSSIVKWFFGLFKIPGENVYDKGIAEVMQTGFNMMAATVIVPAAVATTASYVDESSDLIKDVEVKIEPLGAGAGIKINPSKLVKGLSKALKLIGEELLKTLIFTFSFWLFEPVKYTINPFWRKYLPIEIPTFHEMIKTTRRYLPTEVAEDAIQKLRDVMAMRGYPVWFEDATVGGLEVEGFDITDRFGVKRTIPTALLYELPTPTDTVRFMLRDIIQDVGDFEKIMIAQGFTKDIALMYYLLHFRYPALDKLYDFVCRTAAGLAWFTAGDTVRSEYERFVKEYGLGFTPKSPAELNNKLPSDPQKAIESIRDHILSNLDKISPYLKWHDYFPASWVEGWTSDQMIIADLMADIPMRIDARWMYKWGVIDEIEVLRIVTARGMHPDWIEKIAVAEMMNALAEERTYVRTGIINAFKEGFMTGDALKKQLSHLTDITLLGKKRPVKFLEGEVHLLHLRALYDRALDVLRDTVKYLGRAYSENIVPYDAFTENVKKVIEAMNESLGLSLTFDEKYYDAYRVNLDILHEVDTVYRLRRWLRYMLYRLMARFESGYIGDDEAKQIIEEIKTYGRLTDEEVEFFSTILAFLKSSFDRRAKVDAVLKKLSKGIISKDEAIEQLVEAGLDKETAEALIETKAKTYTLSIGTYLAYADVIDIDESLLKRKMELMGVPPDEQELILQVFRIKPVKSEQAKVLSELLDEFADGYISEDELKKRIEALGIRRVGLEFLIVAAKIRKEAKYKKYAIDAILDDLRRGIIDKKEALEELKKYVADENIAKVLIEKSTRTYTLSIGTYLAYADLIEIPTELMVKKLELMGVPPDERELVLQVFKLKPIKSEMAKYVSAMLESFEDGYIDEKTLRENLSKLGLRKDSLELLIAAKKVELAMKKKKLLVDAILNRLRRGVISLSKARDELKKLIVDEELIDALIERNIRTYTFSVDKMISMAEYVPIDMDWIIEKAKTFGYPEEEIKLIPAYKIARELSSEINKMVTELGNAYVNGLLSDDEFKKALDELATLGGKVKDLGVEWIVLSPEERALIYELYRIRKARKLASSS